MTRLDWQMLSVVTGLSATAIGLFAAWARLRRGTLGT